MAMGCPECGCLTHRWTAPVGGAVSAECRACGWVYQMTRDEWESIYLEEVCDGEVE